MKLSDEYIAQLRAAMRSAPVRSFVHDRLTKSLSAIDIDQACIVAIKRVLDFFTYRKILTPELVTAAMAEFQKAWRVYLNRKYFIDYEVLRWPYLRDYVLREIDSNLRMGRCLDIGCGRGWLTSQLVLSGMADSAVGIDAAEYEPEWKDCLTRFKRTSLSFEREPVGELSDWVKRQSKFDTILMLYVLHHSTEYWGVRTLHSLLEVMSPGSRLIILEDSFSRTMPAKHDRDCIDKIWPSLSSTSEIYALTAAFHIQLVLDFVAVQLLANFSDVQMPCTYKRVDEWEHLFTQVGFRIEKSVYLGFPKERDIDVPQSFFSLRPQ
jgi:SAM-dependent methyltransferase